MIIEKKLGISGDYQFKAINSKNPLQRNWHRNKFDIIENYFNSDKDLKNKKVLDLGTGSGNFEILFHNKFKYIVGADYNDEALEFLKSKLSENNITNVELIISDFTKFKTDIFKDKFDYIILVDVIEHFKVESAKKLLPNLLELLNDKGKVIVITPNYSSLWILIEKVLDKVQLVPKFQDEQHLAKYNTYNIVDLFSKNFKNIKLSTFNTLSYLALSYSLNKFINNLEEKIKFKHGNLIFSVFEKN